MSTNSPLTLALRAIKPPSPRLIASSTFVHRGTLERRAKWLADDAAARRGKPKYEPKFLMLTVDLDRADKLETQRFRARKREWRARARFIVPKMFVGLAAVSGRLFA